MKYTRRLVSLLMSLVMLLSMVSMPALAEESWQLLSITLSWTDAEGMPGMTEAYPVPWSQEQAYWAQVEPTAPFEALTISLFHPEYEYTFDPADGTQLMDVVDTGAMMDEMAAIHITAYEGDEPMDNYVLYISTQMMPEEAPEELPEEDFEEEPVAPAQGTVKVQHADLNGNVLYAIEQLCIEGEDNTVYAMEIDGYTAMPPTAMQVTVNPDGTTNPDTLTFYYEENYVAPAQAEVTVEYRDLKGNLLGSDTMIAIEGENNMAYARDMEGYTALEPVSVAVEVLAEGEASPNPVVFHYEENYVAPAQAEVIVEYRDMDGNFLGSDTMIAVEGEENIAYAPELEGYVATAASQSVHVDEMGMASPNPVVFYYEKQAVEPARAMVTIEHRDTKGNVLFYDDMPAVQGQANTVYAEDFDGYIALEPKQVNVEVFADGTASPNPVVFVYQPTDALEGEEPLPDDNNGETAIPTDAPVEPEVTSAKVKIHYVEEGTYAQVAPTQTRELENGLHMITAAPEYLADGFVPVGEPNVAIEVAGGVADPAEIFFVYRFVQQEEEQQPEEGEEEPMLPAEPVFAQVTVLYQDEAGKQIIAPQTMNLEAGQIAVITPDASLLPEYYEPVDVEPVTVHVDLTGMADKDMVIFVYRAVAPETPIPQGALINRFGKVNDRQVKFREDSNTKAKVLKSLKKNTVVWMVQEILNENNVSWTRVVIDGVEGYIMSKYVDVMSQRDSDAYEAANCPTPVPDYPAMGEDDEIVEMPVVTAEPTATPTAKPTRTPKPTKTPKPTRTPTPPPFIDDDEEVLWPGEDGQPEEDDVPAQTPGTSGGGGMIHGGNATAAPQQSGYALMTARTALRTEPGSSDENIITYLPKDTLVVVDGQTTGSSGKVWNFVATLDNLQGYVPENRMQYLTAAEAAYYIALWEESNPVATATPTARPTEEPPVQQGYAYTIGDGVYFRAMPSTMSDIKNVLAQNIVVYVQGQQYENGVAWHIVRFDNEWGYIRADMLRMMSAWEVDSYLNSLTQPTIVPQTTPQPYDEEALSSYGYVTAKTVNFRKAASTDSTKLKTLKQYAFCLILGTEVVDGDVWYHVNFNGEKGYLHSNYFKQMTVAEFEDFYGSEEYQQGVKNNTPTSNQNNTNNNNANSNTSGIVSPEDQTVDAWTDPNSGVHVSYAPFDPFATVAPIATPEPTLETLPTAEPTLAPLPDPQETAQVIYPQEEVESGSALGVIIGVLIAATLIGGGVYGYVLYQRGKKQQAAKRAAAKRAAAQRTAGQRPASADGRPYARPMQQRPGTYPQQQRAPYAPQQPGNQPPVQQPSGSQYARQQNPYARPAASQSPSAQNPNYRRPDNAPQQPHSYSASYRPAEGDAPSYSANYRPEGSAPVTTRRRRQQSSYLEDENTGV